MTADSIVSLAVSVVTLLFVVVVAVRLRRRKSDGRRSGPGAGATGAVYDLLNEDKRRAVEIIAESRAEATDPERARKNED